MKRLIPLFCALLLYIPAMVAAQEQFEIYGFSYFAPPEVVGTVSTVVAFLEPPVGFTYPITVDFDNNEYTFYFQSTIQTITAGAYTTTYNYADATFTMYEDPAKNGDYGTNPPNGTSPSTFQDGTAILTGTLSNITRIDYNAGFPEPTIVANCTFTGGTRFGELVQGNNWTFHGGLSSNFLLGIPTGYQRNWATKIIFSGPLPAESSTWGNIKALYVSN
jgi:hypothetical protein